jgi:hypothetical protein
MKRPPPFGTGRGHRPPTADTEAAALLDLPEGAWQAAAEALTGLLAQANPGAASGWPADRRGAISRATIMAGELNRAARILLDQAASEAEVASTIETVGRLWNAAQRARSTEDAATEGLLELLERGKDLLVKRARSSPAGTARELVDVFRSRWPEYGAALTAEAVLPALIGWSSGIGGKASKWPATYDLVELAIGWRPRSESLERQWRRRVALRRSPGHR